MIGRSSKILRASASEKNKILFSKNIGSLFFVFPVHWNKGESHITGEVLLKPRKILILNIVCGETESLFTIFSPLQYLLLLQLIN